MCDCKVGPGKFEGEPALTFLAWDATMDGGCDATTGDPEDGSQIEWLRAPFDFHAEALDAARGLGFCEACIQEATASTVYGVAVWESEQGFVSSREFATEEEFEASLAEEQAEDAGPEIHVFELTAAEVAERDDDAVWDFMKRAEFRLAGMSSRVREDMLDAMVAELGIKGGFYYRIGEDGFDVGPFETRQEAQNDAEGVVEG